MTFLEPFTLLASQSSRHPREPAIVAWFAGAETTRLWRPPERFVGDAQGWRRRREEALSSLAADWEATHVRYGTAATRASFATALGGRASDVLGAGFEDAFEAIASATPSSGETDWSRRSSLRRRWEQAYGGWGRSAERALARRDRPPDPFAAVASGREATPPFAPIHVSTYEVERRCPAQALRHAIVENEGRLLPSGRRVTCGVVAGLRGHHDFSRLWLSVTEGPRLDWERTRTRVVEGWEGGRSTIRSSTTTTFPDRASFVDAVGPRLIRAIGGRRTLDLLAPTEVPRDVLPLRATGRRRTAPVAPTSPVSGDEDHPMFGTF